MEEEIYLSVVIPAYNEAKRILKTLDEINSYLLKQDYSYEILVVSDGSKDETAQVVCQKKAAIKNLEVIDNKQNHGKGYVVRQGMLEARGKYRLFTDADNSTSIDQVEKMWPYFKEGFGVVIGSRDAKGAKLEPPQPAFRRFVGDVFKLYRKIMVGLWRVEDTQCGFKAFSKEAAKAVFPKCLIDRFAFDPEILIVAKRQGFKIKEIPIIWKNDLASTVKFSSMIKMALDLVKIRWNLTKRAYGKKQKRN